MYIITAKMRQNKILQTINSTGHILNSIVEKFFSFIKNYILSKFRTSMHNHVNEKI